MKELSRRDVMKGLAALGAVGASGCRDEGAREVAPKPEAGPGDVSPPDVDVVMDRTALPVTGPWPARDPFLFCVHHHDAYPAGDGAAAPATALAGRRLGNDFSNKDGWSMYHGQRVPGFPRHPHRGFETVTVVNRGLIDHADSLGCAARYGDGDVQWLTAGDGINHSEMFPLLETDEGNGMSFMQLWLNLPARHKRVPPEFTMLWREEIPDYQHVDSGGRTTKVRVVAGALDGHRPPSPPTHSWASEPRNAVAIWWITMAPEAAWTMPEALPGITRDLYLVSGEQLTVGARPESFRQRLGLDPGQKVLVRNGTQPAELLVLQGRPIEEPVVRHGPFAMTSRAEIQEAIRDYQRTRFGGWPWPSPEPVHGVERSRFARRGDVTERPA